MLLSALHSPLQQFTLLIECSSSCYNPWLREVLYFLSCVRSKQTLVSTMSRKLVSNHISGPRTALNVFFNAHARVTPLASNKVSKSANSPKEILYRERANDVHFDFWCCGHLQPLAATCSGSHLQPLVTQASKFQHCTLSSLCKNCKISSSLALQNFRIYSRKSLGLFLRRTALQKYWFSSELHAEKS